MQDNTPHFLRFTRTLALGSTIAALAASTGCGSSVGADSGNSQDIPTVSDATDPSDNFDPCSRCECRGFLPPDAMTAHPDWPACETLSSAVCCAAVGPLPPPELV